MDEETYLREINKASLTDIAAAINDEEAGGTEFVKATITWYENKFTNLALFRYLDPPGTLVDGVVSVIEYGKPAADGSARIWTGAMVVDGTNKAVSIYREKSGE